MVADVYCHSYHFGWGVIAIFYRRKKGNNGR